MDNPFLILAIVSLIITLIGYVVKATKGVTKIEILLERLIQDREEDRREDKEERERGRQFRHLISNTVQNHEGRITNLEDAAKDIRERVISLELYHRAPADHGFKKS